MAMVRGAQVLAHGVTGGVLSKLQGGSFSAGFKAAGLAKAITLGTNTLGGIFKNAEAGKIHGGQFLLVAGSGYLVNGKLGAINAAAGYLFNQVLSGGGQKGRIPKDELKRLGEEAYYSADEQQDVLENWLEDKSVSNPNYLEVSSMSAQLGQIKGTAATWQAGSIASDFGSISFSIRPTSGFSAGNFMRKLLSPFVDLHNYNYQQSVNCNFSAASCSLTITNTGTGDVLYSQ